MAERACWGIGPFARRVKEEATHGRTKAFGRFVRTAPRGAAAFHEVSMHSHEYRYRSHAAGADRAITTPQLGFQLLWLYPISLKRGEKSPTSIFRLRCHVFARGIRQSINKYSRCKQVQMCPVILIRSFPLFGCFCQRLRSIVGSASDKHPSPIEQHQR